MEKYKIKQYVMHYREGLSIIESKTTMNNLPYFVLTTCNGGGEKIFVPMDHTETIIRPISSIDQVNELILFIRTIEPEYITNTKQRRDNFKKRLCSGDIKDLGFLFRQLYFFNHPEKLEKPVKFGPADLEMLKTASNILFDELALTYKIDKDSVEDYLIAKIG